MANAAESADNVVHTHQVELCMATPTIARIDQAKLRDNAYSALKDAFTTGAFAPGDVLNLRTLSNQLGTSMTPVREAVRRLVAEGALIDTPSRTLQVPTFDAGRMNELRTARIALESELMKLSFSKLTGDKIDVLEAILSGITRSEDSMPDLRQNYEFHFAIYRASESQVLLPIVEALWLQYGSYLNLIVNHPDTKIIEENKFHLLIIKALRERNLEMGITALVDDINRSFFVLQPNDVINT